MTSDQWTHVILGQLIEISHGFAFKGEYFHDEFPGDILLTPGNFAIGGGFKPDKFKYYRGPVPADYVLSPGDLLVTMTDLSKESDTLGLPALLPEPPTGAVFLHNQRLGKVLVRPGAQLDKRYLYYLLSSSSYRHEILASATGTTVKHTSPSRITKFAFHLPPYAEQRAIASILGALDEKIELNRRMNATLEAMARAIFQSWFVDFDPVRAKAEGRDTGLPAEIAALFPDGFVESELGEIPREWKVVEVKDIADVSSGKRPMNRDTSSTVISPVPLWGGNGPMGFVPEPLFSEPILLTGRVGTLGSVFRITTPCWPSDNTLIVRLKDFTAFEFLLFQLQRINFSALNRGSTQPLLTQRDLNSHHLVLPTQDIIWHFCTTIRPLFQQLDANSDESERLATIRNILLPKLISGELRVSNAEVLDEVLDEVTIV